MKILVVAGIAVIIVAILYLLKSNSNYYSGKVSKNFNGEVFVNADNPDKKTFFDFMKWQFTAKKGYWPDEILNRNFDIPPMKVLGSGLRVSFVGHSTVLIQTAGLNILTDPLWSDRASPVSFAGPKRIIKPGIKLDNLPKIDVVLLSHNHYDHMDLPTLKKLALRDNPRVIVPLGNDTIIKSYDKLISVEAYNWDDVVEINEQVKIHIEEAQHWSARGMFDRNKALWAAFTVEAPCGKIYFAGDTGYSDHFVRTQEKHGKFLLALLPIGAFEPRWFMSHSHINPEEAMKAFFDLKAEYALAIHYGTFKLADEAYDEPAERIKKLIAELNINPDIFKLLPVGSFWNVKSKSLE